MKKYLMHSQKVVMTMLLLLVSAGIFAQAGFRYRADSTYRLTEDQMTQIQDLRLEYQQEVNDIRNDLAIFRAELQKLKSAENPNLNQINSKLEEIGDLNTEMAQAEAELEVDIYNLLTDEQKAYYQARPGSLGNLNRDYNNRRGNMMMGRNRR